MRHPLILALPLGGSAGARIWHWHREMFPVDLIFCSDCPSTSRISGMQDQVVHCIERMLDMGNSTFADSYTIVSSSWIHNGNAAKRGPCSFLHILYQPSEGDGT